MIKRDYFSHDIPGAGKVFDEMSARGYCYKVAGENIGWNNYPDDVATAQIQSMFMGSSGHRANILGKDWDHIGIGAYKGPDGKKMWTVLFADRCGAASRREPSPSRGRPNTAPKPAATEAEGDAQAEAEADRHAEPGPDRDPGRPARPGRPPTALAGRSRPAAESRCGSRRRGRRQPAGRRSATGATAACSSRSSVASPGSSADDGDPRSARPDEGVSTR